jgi:two-component system, cell cycle response regulator
MLEVDHFLAYNHRAGEPQGDACLKLVADAIKKSVRRPGDYLARYGPGRFGVVLGGVGAAGATVLAEMLRDNVGTLKLPNPASTTSPNLTLTLGVASATPQLDAPWQEIALIAAAERGLSQARDAGRNRVVFNDSAA